MKTMELLRAYAMTLIGSMFIVFGATYFTPQDEYRVPRILIPVYNVLGHTGLAICMLILGALLIFMAYRRIISVHAKPLFLLLFAGLIIAGGLFFNFSGKQDKKASIESLREKLK